MSGEADLMRAVVTDCGHDGLPVPCYRTVKRRVDAIDRKRIVARRLGPRATQQAFGPVGASPLNSLQSLDMLQVDHTSVDVIVVDEQDRLPIGRPWLTLAIDVASRVVAGFTVSLEAPSTVSVALALTHAVLRKETWLVDRDLDVEWPVAGIPVCVHVDNAPEFESAAIVRGTQRVRHRTGIGPYDDQRLAATSSFLEAPPASMGGQDAPGTGYRN